MHLAALDSSYAPAGDALVVEVGGELRAALFLSSGHVIADPFQRTAELVSMLRVRARQLGGERQRTRVWRRVLRVAPRSV